MIRLVLFFLTVHATALAVMTPCARMDAEYLLALDPASRVAALKEPSVVTGLLTRWEMNPRWIDTFTFDGGHPDDPADEDRRGAREALLQVFQDLYGVPPPFNRTERLRLSYNQWGGGVSWCMHGFSWLGLVSGEKRWWFVPPTSHNDAIEWPTDAKCARGPHESMKPPEGTGCELTQHAGELVVVPTGWLHSTCNVKDGLTLGFGGEDDCDKVGCSCPKGAKDRTEGCVCPGEQLHADCHGARGEENARRTVQGRFFQSGSGYVEAPRDEKLFEEANQLVRRIDTEALLALYPDTLHRLRERVQSQRGGAGEL